MSEIVQVKEFTHFHFFCGLGAAAKGFNKGKARVGNVVGRMRCIGGVDVMPDAIEDFARLAKVKGAVLDLFSREQYTAFHGHEPPIGWRAATTDDIRAAAGGEFPDIVFLSAPCKGFSGLLAETTSKTDKYQALNQLTLRGVWLMLEAFKDNPPSLIIFENVPRIMTRGRPLLDQIASMIRHYGYAWNETTHDCGVIGNLAQSRKRFLGVGRHTVKVPPFLYEPPKRALRGVGEVLDRMPLPGDPLSGPMHRVPALQWKTWVRLALVEAGKDWRCLNDLVVEDGHLRDYGIVPEADYRGGMLGVQRWDEPARVIDGRSTPTNGRFSVADPRVESRIEGSGHLGVKDWSETSGTITGDARPSKGPFGVADPRAAGMHHGVLGVVDYDQPSGVVGGASKPLNGRFAVADPRPQQSNQEFGQYGVRPWDAHAGAVTGQHQPGGGPNSVADPRMGDRTPFNNVFRIVAYDATAPAVTSAKGAMAAVADPRMAEDGYTKTKYRVTPYDGVSRTVIGASTTGDGAFAVADPRGLGGANDQHGKYPVTPYDEHTRAVIGGRDNGAFAVADPRTTHGPNAHTNKMRVVDYAEPIRTVTGSDRVGSGAMSVADPRPAGLNREGRGTGPDDKTRYVDHYGVLDWVETSKTVSGHAALDNGRWAVADPRVEFLMPELTEQLVCVILARDGTWHRPFTTLELAALQSLYDPDDAAEGLLHLVGKSDSGWRERIGNAVPSAAAEAVAGVMLKTLLLAHLGETFVLSTEPVWVQPERMLQIALSVDVSGQIPA